MKNLMMNLEFLPDEIFLDLFDYFNGPDLLHAYYGLNSRFNWLLYKQYRTYRFNFNSISKPKFHILCQEHLPFLVDRIISLHLSDDKYTPQQIELFFSYIPSVSQFSNLRLLSLSGIRTYERLLQIINDCHRLYHLTYFRFNFPSASDNVTICQSIIDKIWTLPKLSFCDISPSVDHELNTWTSTNIDSSIERLSLSRSLIDLQRINHICQCTHRLKYLSIESCGFDDDYTLCLLPTLLEFHIRVYRIGNISNIISLIQNMSNLRVLNINLLFNIIDGYQWEQIISNYLFKLKKFQFKMVENHLSDQNLEERINELMNSFQSRFWTHEHQWFVRCISSQKMIYICTPSYTLSSDTDGFPDTFVSTDPNDNLQRFCDERIEIVRKAYFDQPIPSNIRLTKLQRLHIDFPIHDQFWSIVSHLDRLKSLTIYADGDTSPSQFQTLLDRAPNLYKLTVYKKSSESEQFSISMEPWYIELLKCTHSSIRHLTLDTSPCLSTKEECIEFAQSSLGTQCEILIVKTHHRESIVSLVKSMMNLRALTVYCDYHIDDNASLSSTATIDSDNREVNLDEMVKWLTERLPSTCSIGCERLFFGTSVIRIWIS